MTCFLLTVRFNATCLTALTQCDANSSRQDIPTSDSEKRCLTWSLLKSISKKLWERNMTSVPRRAIGRLGSCGGMGRVYHMFLPHSPRDMAGPGCPQTLCSFCAIAETFHSSPNSSPTGTLGQSNNCEWDLGLTLARLLLVSLTRVEDRNSLGITSGSLP